MNNESILILALIGLTCILISLMIIRKNIRNKNKITDVNELFLSLYDQIVEAKTYDEIIDIHDRIIESTKSFMNYKHAHQLVELYNLITFKYEKFKHETLIKISQNEVLIKSYKNGI